MQLVVFGNGVAGIVNNYLEGMTGTVGTNFVRIAVGNEGLGEEQAINGRYLSIVKFVYTFCNSGEFSIK